MRTVSDFSKGADVCLVRRGLSILEIPKEERNNPERYLIPARVIQINKQYVTVIRPGRSIPISFEIQNNFRERNFTDCHYDLFSSVSEARAEITADIQYEKIKKRLDLPRGTLTPEETEIIYKTLFWEKKHDN